MLNRLPEEVQNFIDKWFELEIDGQKLPTPYFINQGGFLKKPVYAGKGSINEIQDETTKLVAGKGFNSQEILDFMHERGIGIDCSGLVYQIYDFWVGNASTGENSGEVKGDESVGKKSLRDFLPIVPFYNFRKYLSRKTKPQNSMSANEFTSEPFSQRIEVKDVRPGDLIRTKAGNHLLMITEVDSEESGKPKKLKFIQSARFYNRDGIRYGEIELSEDLNLTKSKWLDNDKNEPVNHTFEGWREGVNTNGIFRPKFLKTIN